MVDRLCHILYVGMDLAIIFQSEEFSITVCINLQSDKLRRIANLARDLETELNLQATQIDFAPTQVALSCIFVIRTCCCTISMESFLKNPIKSTRPDF